MKKLYILRHAKSSYPANTDDHERPLNERGEKSCRLIGKYLKENEIIPDRIISSDALRTKQTAKNILRESGIATKAEFTKNLYLATPGEILKEIAKTDNDFSSLMVVCHNPGAEQLAKYLAGSGDDEVIKRLKTKYSTAGLACLTLKSNNWQQLDPACGNLDNFITPKMLGLE